MSKGTPFWDHKYESRDFVYGTEPNRFLVEQTPGRLKAGQKVLTLGEGEGRNAVWLARQGYNVTAVDYSRPALEKLHRLAGHYDVEIRTYLSDVMDFELGQECWDALILLHMHLAPRRRHLLHRRIIHALRPEGYLFLEALRRKQFERKSGGPDQPELFYSAEILCRDFSELTLCRIAEEERFIDAGEHCGMTSVVNLVARR